jgi:prepilin-type N-terminal cleavage/methylation domain-containing protein
MRCRSGFSLVEVTIATMIVAVMMTASLSVVGAGVRSREFVKRAAFAQSLADQMMVEIGTKAYVDASGGAVLGLEEVPSGESRVAFDDVDDFAGLVETPPVENDGTAIAAAGQYVRTVEVVWMDPALKEESPTDTGIKRIRVVVKRQGVPLATVTTLRTRVWEGVTP